jgi:hypothetical protein
MNLARILSLRIQSAVLSYAILCVVFVTSTGLRAQTGKADIREELHQLAIAPKIVGWQSRVGATVQPTVNRPCTVKAHGDERSEITVLIQTTIDRCSKDGGGTVDFAPGVYVTGSLFIKSNVNFHVGKDVTLLGALAEASWPMVNTRVAGIEMSWRAALLNVRDQRNVSITGEGTVDARGQGWWKKFLDAEPVYRAKGLRWAVDYDISRPHMIQIYQSQDVTLRGLTLKSSPFWTVHVVFSKNVTVDGITVRDNIGGLGPSTDGVNVDSSAFVLVQNCDVDNNDDNYSFKSGMNADGLRVNLPVQYTLFRNNIARHGRGVITLGSDMSGGIQHVEAYGMKGIATMEGIRLKSGNIRGGVVYDVSIHDVILTDVPIAISINLNWFPDFSYPVLPTDGTLIPPTWRVLATHVPPEKALPHFRDITISNVKATGARMALKVMGIPGAPIERVSLEHVDIEAMSAGTVSYAKDWVIKDVILQAQDGKPVAITNSENVSFAKP